VQRLVRSSIAAISSTNCIFASPPQTVLTMIIGSHGCLCASSSRRLSLTESSSSPKKANSYPPPPQVNHQHVVVLDFKWWNLEPPTLKPSGANLGKAGCGSIMNSYGLNNSVMSQGRLISSTRPEMLAHFVSPLYCGRTVSTMYLSVPLQ